MATADERARRALREQLLATSPAGPELPLVAGTHTKRFEDNVVSTIPPEQLGDLYAQLAAGDGSETKVDELGRIRAHVPHSSAVAALNAFGGWFGRVDTLTIAGTSGWTELEIEAKTQIKHRGGRANLDALLRSDGRVAGVECKLTETLKRHSATKWADVYFADEMAALLSPDWQAVTAESQAGNNPRHLHLEQLIKHALALNSQYPGDERTLIYCYWEPTNADEIEACRVHREELGALIERLGTNAQPTFRALRYSELFDEWDAVDNPWITEHVAALRARYEIAI